MRFSKITYLCILVLTLNACRETIPAEEVQKIGLETCRKPAEFIEKLGFDPYKSAYSTSDARFKGIILVQPFNDTSFKIWQDSSWTKFGHLGSVTTDENGNAYAAPIPFVNTLENTLATINTLYRINHETAKMEAFVKLPAPDSVAGINPYGVMGIYYDCHGKKLYVSSVAGSTGDNEKGVIYVIDPVNGNITDKYIGKDAIGLFVGGITGSKKLYFGHARSSDIYSIVLDKNGSFVGESKTELSLDGLGPRGMDKARRIRYDKKGNLIVHGIEFNFNLAAQSEKPETVYEFSYQPDSQKWVFVPK